MLIVARSPVNTLVFRQLTGPRSVLVQLTLIAMQGSPGTMKYFLMRCRPPARRDGPSASLSVADINHEP